MQSAEALLSQTKQAQHDSSLNTSTVSWAEMDDGFQQSTSLLPQARWGEREILEKEYEEEEEEEEEERGEEAAEQTSWYGVMR